MQGVEGQNLFKKKFLRPRSLLFRGYLGLQGTRGTRAVGYKELNLFELNINIFVLSPGPQDSWLPPASDQMLLPLPRGSPGLSTHSWPTPPFALAAELLFSPTPPFMSEPKQEHTCGRGLSLLLDAGPETACF